MRKFYLFIISLFIGSQLFADSTFLPGLEFYYLYRENKFIYGASDNGISEEEYLNFLLSDENPLGEKVALISALASYFEFIDLDDNPDKDNENYFETYTALFKEKVRKKYTKTTPPSVRLLEVLLDDYQTLDPNITAYDQIAAEMPQSLTAQSVKVIAFAYDVVYNRRCNRVEKYEDNYLTPYRESWESYERDIDPAVQTKVEEWPEFVYMWCKESLPEGLSVVQEDDSFVSDKELEIEEFFDEGGAYITLIKTVDGENFARFVSFRDSVNRRSEDVRCRWDSDKNSWRNVSKTEGGYDLHDNLILQITYSWDKKANEWLPDEKDEAVYSYDGDTVVETKVRIYFFKNNEWEETYRQECKIPKGESLSCQIYARNDAGEFVLVNDDED